MRRVILFLLFAGATVSAAVAASRIELPEGPGRDLVYGQCQTCHDLQSIADSAGIGRGAWDAVLDNMRNFGLRIDADRRARILDYLATYLGPNPPPETDTAAKEAGAADGARIYDDVCSACHQPDGTGKDGEFPPLAGNPDLFLAPDFPVLVVLNGLRGPIETKGRSFDNVMPPLEVLSDQEIAAVVDFVRGHWGNGALAPADMPKVTPADVTEARRKAMTAEDVHALRKSLLP